MVNVLYNILMGFITCFLQVGQYFYDLATGAQTANNAWESTLSLIQGNWLVGAITVGGSALIIAILTAKPIMLAIKMVNPLG